MRSAIPKALHKVAGLPMVGHVLGTASAAGAGTRAVVVGPAMDPLRAFVMGFAADASVHEQRERLGTAHAVLAAREALGELRRMTWSCSTPIRRYSHRRPSGGCGPRLQRAPTSSSSASDRTTRPAMAASIWRATGSSRSASTPTRATRSAPSRCATPASMAFRGDMLFSTLEKIGKDNEKSEYYLTDAVEIANRAAAEGRGGRDRCGGSRRRQFARPTRPRRGHLSAPRARGRDGRRRDDDRAEHGLAQPRHRRRGATSSSSRTYSSARA